MKLNLALATTAALAITNDIVSAQGDPDMTIEVLNDEVQELEAKENMILDAIDSIADEIHSNTERFDTEPIQISTPMDRQGGDDEEGDFVIDFEADDLGPQAGDGGDGEIDILMEPEYIEEGPPGEEEELVEGGPPEEEHIMTITHATEHDMVPLSQTVHHGPHPPKAPKAEKLPQLHSKAQGVKTKEQSMKYKEQLPPSSDIMKAKAAKSTHGKSAKRGKKGTHPPVDQYQPAADGTGKAYKQPNMSMDSKSQKNSSSESIPPPPPPPHTDDEETIHLESPTEDDEETSNDDIVDHIPEESGGVARMPDSVPGPQGIDTSDLKADDKKFKQEIILALGGAGGNTIGKGHQKSQENVGTLELLRAKSEAAEKASNGSAGRYGGIVGGLCLLGSVVYAVMV